MAKAKKVAPIAKAVPAPISGNGVAKVFTVVTDLLDSACIVSRTVKSQTLKAERIIDITTDGLVQSAEWFDTTMRNNLLEAQAQTTL